jgi:hypothetical protein
MELLSWVLICLVLFPLAIAGFAIHWAVLVSEPILMTACGGGRLGIAIVLIVATLCSSVCAFLDSMHIRRQTTKSPLFVAYFLATAIGVLLCAVVVVMTTIQSQRICQGQIEAYYEAHIDAATQRYVEKYNTDYQRLVFQFAFGQTACEVYAILAGGWLASVIGFFAFNELRSTG